MQKTLTSAEHLEAWRQLVKPLAKAKFTEWAENPDPIPIFQRMSDLVMTLVLNIIMGSEFAGEYGDELVPMIQAYEIALQKPQTKVLPRWLSKEGRTLEYVETQMKRLIGEEILRRLENPKKYGKNMDYFQSLLDSMGAEHVEGKPHG